VYDFENHVIQAGAGITMVYDGDGNRVQKTVAGVTTKYLVDTQSPAGEQFDSDLNLYYSTTTAPAT
jgi:YD repeat-containing protein